ncbi:MAG: C10 family peptidase [Bacteroidales bacterium]
MKTRLLFLSAMLSLVLPLVVIGQTATRNMAPNTFRGVIEKLPMITTKWSQDCYFNGRCPNDTAAHSTCLHVPAGGGAVAMAQLMKFYQYPSHGTGEHGYAHPKYGIQYANFGATTYNWSNMPDTATPGNEAIPGLIYQCGVAQNMNYGTNASSSVPEEIDSALLKYFGYPDGATWKLKGQYTSPEWSAMMKAELDANHPVLNVCYTINGMSQRYFLCDGYRDDKFHINWGTGGSHDGYFSLDSLFYDSVNFSYPQRALFNLVSVPPIPGSYVMNFENVQDFAMTFDTWTVKDVDLHDTYGITGYTYPHQAEPMAFLAFNPALVTPSMFTDAAIQPHSGGRFGACFSSNPPANNDWFISPQIQLGTNGSFSFWVKSYTDLYGLDTYTVAVSTTDNNPGSFTVISGAQPLQTTTAWAKKTFNLSNFNNQKVYVAINCVSTDHFLMMIDDLEVKPEATSLLTADFTSDKTSVRVGDTVNFSDQSSGLPVSWSWTFPGGIPSASNLKNPSGIKYTTAGIYPVSLKISNGATTDSIIKMGYITVNGYPTFMSLDFESLTDFSTSFVPWSVYDVLGGTTYGIQNVTFPHNYQPMAYICFNPAQTTPPLVNMQTHSGLRLGCCFSSIPPMAPNDKWLISPKMSLGLNPQIELWVKTYNNQFGDEKYNIAVSNTSQSVSSFIPLTTIPESAPVEWTRRTYSLSNYTNQDVYIGIQCVTNDGFIFMVDDISITSSLGTDDISALKSTRVFPNPAKDFLMIDCPRTLTNPLMIEMVSMVGAKIASWTETPVAGRIVLDVRSIPQGIYLVRVSTTSVEVTRKVSIIH